MDTPLHHASDFELDAMGRIYIAGDHVPVVFRVDTDDRVHTVAGTQNIGNSGDGGPALEAELGVPFGVEPDDAGGFYISDVDAHVVRYVNPQGIISTVAGVTQTDGTPFPGYSGNGGLGTAAQINGPGHLQIGPDKALYFCETKNHVVRRLGSDGIISTFAGSGARGYAGDGHPAVEARLDSPRDLRFAPNGDLYIADTNNNVIRRVDTNGIITTVVGNGDGDVRRRRRTGLAGVAVPPLRGEFRHRRLDADRRLLEPPRTQSVALPALTPSPTLSKPVPVPVPVPE